MACRFCNDIGIIIYKKQVEKDLYQDYGARCICKKGMEKSQRIPTLDEVGLNFSHLIKDKQVV